MPTPTPVPPWLDELSLKPGPPWLGMDAHSLAVDAWLAPDSDQHRDRQWKAALLEQRPASVFRARDTPAVRVASQEVLDLIMADTGITEVPEGLHPLDAAGRMVQEDLCLMVLRDGAAHLDAASLCFPAYWRLEEKLGLPMAAVHAPVPHYGEELSDKVDMFLQRLRPERPVWRRNWAIHDDPSYFLPDPTPPYTGRAPDGLYLRSERQTLRRLTRAEVVLFTIRTQQVPLAVVADRPELAHSLAVAIDAWSPELVAYRGTHGARAARGWLATR